MAFYIKLTPEVADALGITSIRNKTADGNILAWQADLTGIEGDTILDRAARIGGACLSPQQAKREIDGTESPAEVYTPDEYRKDTPTPLPEDRPAILPELPEEGGTL